MTRSFLISFFCLTLTFSQLMASTINLRAVGFEGKYARLYSIADFVSFQEVKKDVALIGKDGSCTLNNHMVRSELIRIRIDDITATLIATPDMELEIVLNYDEAMNRGRIFDKSFEVRMLNNSDQGINEQIWMYQKAYADFIERNERNLLTKKMLPEVQKFRDDMNKRFGKVTSEYFNIFLQYDLGALEDAVLGSENTLYSLYFEQKPLHFDNMGYMNFLVQFYQERFIQISQGKDGFQVLSAVNGTQDYQKLLAIVNEHKFTWNDTISEWLIVLGMKEVYGDETFKKQKVLNMLDYIGTNGIHKENRRMARNIFEELNFLKPGEKASDFNLKDLTGNLHHMKGMKVNTLLFFWSANSNTCLREMEFMNEYQEKYKDKLQVVAINIDNDPSKARKYEQGQAFQFLSLYKDRQFDITDKYRVFSVPMYVLIDQNNRIIRYPAPRPEENLESYLHQLQLKH